MRPSATSTHPELPPPGSTPTRQDCRTAQCHRRNTCKLPRHPLRRCTTMSSCWREFHHSGVNDVQSSTAVSFFFSPFVAIRQVKLDVLFLPLSFFLRSLAPFNPTCTDTSTSARLYRCLRPACCVEYTHSIESCPAVKQQLV